MCLFGTGCGVRDRLDTCARRRQEAGVARVMFLHGLESGPLGAKTHRMRERGLEVVAPDQHMSKWRLDRRNSFARRLLAKREVAMALGLPLMSLLGGGRRVRRTLTLALASAGWIARQRRTLVSTAMPASHAGTALSAPSGASADGHEAIPTDLQASASAKSACRCSVKPARPAMTSKS